MMNRPANLWLVYCLAITVCVQDCLGLGDQLGHQRVSVPRVESNALLLPDLVKRAVDLRKADLSSFSKGGPMRRSDGRLMRVGYVLVQFFGNAVVSCIGVADGSEGRAVEVLKTRKDVVFAEVDIVQTRASGTDDPYYFKQWHHGVLGSPQAWDFGMNQSGVKVAIVDAPFQMDHPDLAGNVVDGWDVVSGEVIHSSPGIVHSTLCAGLVGAVLNNGLGVGGVANCRVLPINITGATSEMCQAVYWAADHGVRVVSISWTGADSEALNAAGMYLRVQARGLLVMAGGNGVGYLDYVNQPDIWCVAMTDAADNPRSKYGNSIDFAAPGYSIFSTSIQGGYGSDSGTSYAAPIVAGVVARLMTINPLLGSEEVIDILKATSVDLGNPGWDMWYGWGRIQFGAAAVAAHARLPRLSVTGFSEAGLCMDAGVSEGVVCQLWRQSILQAWDWLPVTNSYTITNAGRLFLIDPTPFLQGGFYRVSFP